MCGFNKKVQGPKTTAFLATLCPDQCSMGEESSSAFFSSELTDGKLNLLRHFISSAVRSGGLAAIVGANKRGSLSLSDTSRATRSTSSILT